MWPRQLLFFQCGPDVQRFETPATTSCVVWLPYNRAFPILPPDSCNTAAVCFTYPHAIISQGMVTCPCKQLSFRSIWNNNTMLSSFIFLWCFSFFFKCRVKFLHYVIYLLPEELLLTVFGRIGLLVMNLFEKLFIIHFWRIILLGIYDLHLEGIQPCNMKNRDIYWRRYKKHCTQDNDPSVPFKVGTLGPHKVLPITLNCLIIFSWISLMVWMKSLSFQRWF